MGHGGASGGGHHPIAIPGTSVRRYMHVQLLLALMSMPGLPVVAPAKVSWDRLGYFPVDAVFGPPKPGARPPGPPRLTPTSTAIPTMPGLSPHSHFGRDPTGGAAPSKRPRLGRGLAATGGGVAAAGSVHDTMPGVGGGGGAGAGAGGAGGAAHTGAMAMPPPQHSPRTSAILSGLPVGEGAMMLGDAGELLPYASMSPTSFVGMGGMGGMGPMSPYQFPPPGAGGGGGGGGSGSGGGVGGDILGGGGGGTGGGFGIGAGIGGGSDGSGGSGGDPGQHFDFAAAMGCIGGGSQGLGMVPNYNFSDFASMYSPNPVSPSFGSRLSPLAGMLSPQSLSPRPSVFQGFTGSL